MLLSEKKLPIEIAEVDRIQIHDVNLAEAGENKVLEEFTANAPRTDHQNPGLISKAISDSLGPVIMELTCLIREYKVPKDCLGNRSRPMVGRVC